MNSTPKRDRWAQDREALAGLIVADEAAQFGPAMAASRILNSDWLKARDAEAAARALLDAADEQERLAYGPRALGNRGVAFKRLIFAGWLRERAVTASHHHSSAVSERS